MKKEIFLSDYFGKNIFTRNSMSSFFDQINKIEDQKIVLNFKNMGFISRSCADEYLKQKANTRKEITETDVSQEISAMLNAVQVGYEKNDIEVTYEPNSPRKTIYA